MAYDERFDRDRGRGREAQWRGDPAFSGGWVESVDVTGASSPGRGDGGSGQVRLNLPAEATARWREEERSRALFDREGRGERGPHILNRSFPGPDPDEE